MKAEEMTRIGKVVHKEFDFYVMFNDRLRKIHLGPWEDLYLVHKGKKYDVAIIDDVAYLTGITY